MIVFLKNWIEQIVIAVIIVSIFEMILPNGNLKKYIKITLGMYIVFCLISPFVNSNALYNFENIKIEDFATVEDNNQINQESMDKRLQSLYVEELENDIKKQVEKSEFKVYYCKVEAILKSSDKNAGISEINLIVGKKGQNINTIENIGININNKQERKNEILTEDLKQLRVNIASHYEIKPEFIKLKLK